MDGVLEVSLSFAIWGMFVAVTVFGCKGAQNFRVRRGGCVRVSYIQIESRHVYTESLLGRGGDSIIRGFGKWIFAEAVG